jgi:hypothetical protein
MAIIICLFGLDVAGQYNCQVRVSHVCFICAHFLMVHDPEVEIVFQLVSSTSDESGLYCLTPFFF